MSIKSINLQGVPSTITARGHSYLAQRSSHVPEPEPTIEIDEQPVVVDECFLKETRVGICDPQLNYPPNDGESMAEDPELPAPAPVAAPQAMPTPMPKVELLPPPPQAAKPEPAVAAQIPEAILPPPMQPEVPPPSAPWYSLNSLIKTAGVFVVGMVVGSAFNGLGSAPVATANANFLAPPLRTIGR